MHAHEVHTDVALVLGLLEAQFPDWASLPLERLQTAGTVNALYRLGTDLLVRLPRTDWGIGAVEREIRWLPRLAPRLPVRVPVPLAKGMPAGDYPYEWGVYPWLEGDNPTVGAISDPRSLAKELARFVTALHGVDPAGAPAAVRGSSLRPWDEPTRAALASLSGVVDTDAATAVWDAALRTPGWSAPGVWVHGDLMPGNLLLQGASLSGVIDWGGMGLADPACDLMVAWNLLSAETRGVFRAELEVDDATWARGRGWALWTGLVALPYYKDANPELAENARFRIAEVLAD